MRNGIWFLVIAVDGVVMAAAMIEVYDRQMRAIVVVGGALAAREYVRPIPLPQIASGASIQPN